MTNKYKYIKSNAFTIGASQGNPAATIFAEKETMSPELMQQIATEHKGFVMETVFYSPSEAADCKLTYFSSECEVDFCGHGTIATMYSVIKDSPTLASKEVLTVETNKKGIVSIYNSIHSENAIYIEAPAPIEHPMQIPVDEIEHLLSLPENAIVRNKKNKNY